MNSLIELVALFFAFDYLTDDDKGAKVTGTKRSFLAPPKKKITKKAKEEVTNISSVLTGLLPTSDPATTTRIFPSILPNGLPGTLPINTVVRGPTGQSIVTTNPLPTSQLLGVVPPGTTIITPTGITYTTPGAVASPPVALPPVASTPVALPPVASPGGLTFEQQLLLGGVQALAPAIPAVIGGLGEIGSGFWDWLTNGTDTQPAIAPGSPGFYEDLFGGNGGLSGAGAGIDYGELFGIN